jgi:hypothetical protein
VRFLESKHLVIKEGQSSVNLQSHQADNSVRRQSQQKAN